MQALIVGGGIAGPMTAMALQRVGIQSSVFESHGEADPEHASYFTVSANGLEASMALEDAIVLARTLRDERSPAAAFGAYERERRARVERVVAWGARGSSDKAPGALGRVVRDLMLPLVFRFLVTDRSVKWMYDHRVSLDAAAASVAPG